MSSIEDAIRELIEEVIGESEDQIADMTERECSRYLGENLDDAVERMLRPMVEECLCYSDELRDVGQRMDVLEDRFKYLESDLEKPGKLRSFWLSCKTRWQKHPFGQAAQWVVMRFKSKKGE